MPAIIKSQVAAEWTGGFIDTFTINTDSSPLSNWTVAFDSAITIDNIWNAQVISHVGTHYVLGAMPYNAALGTNASTSFGLQASGGTSASITNLVVGSPTPGLPGLTVWDMDIGEPASGSAETSFAVQLSAPSAQAVTVHYATVDGTATAGQDYTAVSGTLTFAPGQTQQTVALDILGDNLVEGNEQFSIVLSSPTNAVLTKGTGVVTVHDTTPPPAITVGDVVVTAPTSGSATASFTVTMSKVAAVPITVDYTTQDGSAHAGADYTATHGTLTFAAGQTTATVSVPITANAAAAHNAPESFTLHLSNASIGNLTKDTGTGSIIEPFGPTPSLTVGDVALSEPASGSANASFTVQLSAASLVPVTVHYATADGTAKAGTEYTATSGDLTFAAGETSKVVTVAVQQDGLVTGDESFTLNLSGNNAAAGIAKGTATATVHDTTPPPAFSITDVTVAEPASGSANATFTVSMSKAAAVPLTVHYATQDGTAHAGSEYTATSGDLTFAAGETSKTVTVAVLQDMLANGASSFQLALSAPSLGSLAKAQGTGTITDSGITPITASVADTSVTEPASGTANAAFTITLNKASAGPVTVSYATVDGTAHAGTDYVATTGTVTFAAGETSKVVNVAVDQNGLVTGDESFQLALSAPVGAKLGTATGTATVHDSTPAPTFSVADITTAEPVTGSANAAFTITMSKAAAVPVTVHYATADGTAKAGTDYTATSGSVTFAAGETQKVVNVAVQQDNLVDGTESFALNLSAPKLGTLAKASATATVTDTTPPPTISVGDIALAEPASGSANATFTVTLSKAAAIPVTLHYATADGTAHAGSEYTATSGDLTFAAGETSKTVTVAVNQDGLVTGDDSFALNLSGPSIGTFAKASATATLHDSTPAPTFSVSDVAVSEPASGTVNAGFTITMSKAAAVPVTVHYATADGTATAGTDYAATSGTVTFAAGETSKLVNVAVNADAAADGAETFALTLTAPSLGTIAHATGTATVSDSVAGITVNDVTVQEPGTGSVVETFTVTLNQASAQTVTVCYGTVDGTAVSGTNYVQAAGKLSFAPGETSKTVTVTVNADAAANDGDESFALVLSGQSAGTLAKATGTATPHDAVPPPPALPTLAVSDASVAEPATGTATETFTVTLSKAAASAVTVHYATADGSAHAGTDYTAASGTLTFAAGETSKTFTVTVTPNAAIAGNEQFGVTLTAPTGATLADATGVGSITYTPPVSGGGPLKLTETVTSEWGQGFVAQFDNLNTGAAQTGWQASFDAPFNIVNIWNAHVVSHVGSHYVVAGNDYDADLAANSDTNWGFQADGASHALTNLQLTAGGSSVAGSGGGTGGSGGGAVSPPAITVHDAYVSEPTSGTTTVNFIVDLSGADTAPVTVDYATHDGTALAGTDYTASHGTLTFAAGQTEATVSVTVLANPALTSSDAFSLLLANPTGGATLADASATATILGATLSADNPGYLHTDGNQIVNDAGTPVQLNSVSWFGMEGGTMAPNGLWARSYESMMDQMVQLGFNSIRIPYCDQALDAASQATGINYNLNPDLVGLSPLQILDKIVAYADKIGLKIVLDHHGNEVGAGDTPNGLWYDANYSEAKVISNWEMLADRYHNDPSVIGADLDNEPFNGTWGGGGATDWAAAATRIGDAVLAHAPNWLIMVEGVGTVGSNSYWYGGNLTGVATDPIVLDVANRVVYSPHDYPDSVYPQPWFQTAAFPGNEPAIFTQEWGYIYQQNIAPIWLGEFGSKLTNPLDVEWAQAITSYMEGQTSDLTIQPGQLGPSWSWWSWNPNSGDTGGILQDDWTTANLNKIELLQPLMYGLIPADPGGVVSSAAAGGNAALGLNDVSLTGGHQDDILFQNTSGVTWYWHLSGTGLASQGALAWLDPAWKIIGTGDTDGSGKASMLVETPDGFFGMWQLDANHNGTYIGSPGTIDATSFTALALKDFNGDGKADVLFQHAGDNTYWLWNLSGSSITGYANLGQAPAGASYAGAGDFNGDGKADVLWKLADGSLSMSFTDGHAFTTTNAISNDASALTVKAVADFNGDGRADILLQNAQGDTQIWEMAGNIVQKVDDFGVVGGGWQIAQVGDLNGDGKADILWERTDGTLYVWDMNGGTIQAQGTISQVSADWHVVGH